jgi:hypothetical protein
MRFLIISLCFLWVGCASYSKKQGFEEITTSQDILSNPYFSDTNKDYVYKANIDVYNKSFSGLLIIKKIDDNNHRIAFTTEMGNKLFDFSFIEDTFKINYILEDLNKKILINILKKDFKVLVTENIKVSKTFKELESTVFETDIVKHKHFVFTNDTIYKIVRIGNTKEKVIFMFKEISNNIADRITITHNNIKLKITLKSIKS